jgi:hypothetical protein
MCYSLTPSLVAQTLESLVDNASAPTLSLPVVMSQIEKADLVVKELGEETVKHL